MKHLTKEITKEVIDVTTGEVVSATVQKEFFVKDNEPFFLTYSKFLSVLYSINNLSAIKILWKFMEHCTFNTNEVLIPTALKNQIIKDLGISLSSYDKGIKILQNNNLISGKQGLYKINPKICWKGDRSTRDEIINSGAKITIQTIGKDEFEEGSTTIM